MRPGRRGLSEECRASLPVPSTAEAASGEAPPSAPAPPSLPPPSAPPAFPALALELENADEPEEAVVQNSVISSEVNTHGAESELDTATPVGQATTNPDF